jgi:hypothetical protein
VSLLDRKVVAFSELIDETSLYREVQRLERIKDMELESG